MRTSTYFSVPDYKDVKEDKKRMEHFTTICAVLEEYLSDTILPNPAELLSIYGRVIIPSIELYHFFAFNYGSEFFA